MTDMWEHFNAAFEKMNQAFEEADKAFAAAEDFEAQRPAVINRVRFEADTWGKRWRLFWRFQKFAFQVLWRGKVIFQFKARPTWQRQDLN